MCVCECVRSFVPKNQFVNVSAMEDGGFMATSIDDAAMKSRRMIQTACAHRPTSKTIFRRLDKHHMVGWLFELFCILCVCVCQRATRCHWVDRLLAAGWTRWRYCVWLCVTGLACIDRWTMMMGLFLPIFPFFCLWICFEFELDGMCTLCVCP